jgi:hypothetical protein
MFTNTKIALAAAMIFGAASAALANDIDESASGAQVERESRQLNQLPWWWQNQNQIDNPGTAYGFAPRTHKPASSRP